MITLDTENIYSVSDAKEILQAAIKKGTCYKQPGLSYRNIICAFDIETSNIKIDTSDNEYKNDFIFNYIKGTTIKCPDITNLKQYERPGLRLSNNKGTPLDVFYNDLVELFRGFMRSGLIDPIEQLKEIITVYDENRKSEDCEKFSIMYCWQFAIDGKVIFGRTWNEFLDLYNILTDYCSIHERLLVFVHNLSHEFQFCRQLLNWHKVFSIAPRKPIYAITEEGVEFRCSYLLTNYNLATLGKQLRHYDIDKLVGSLDYSLYRSSVTPMTEQEKKYCINDVLVVSAYIQECLLQERYLSNLPITATGYCRRYCRKMCLYGNSKKKRNKQFIAYSALMKSLQITGKEEYEQLKRAFAGGFTHASNIYSGITVHDLDSLDFTSSYPYVALSEPLPMSTGKIIKLKSIEEFRKYLKLYCCLFDVELYNVQPKFNNEHYISIYHCYEKVNYVNDNGRLVSADKISITITSIDFEIIEKTYSFSKMKIHNFRVYRKAYLPKELILSICKLYADKTTLKGVKGKETEYLNGKALLNSVY